MTRKDYQLLASHLEMGVRQGQIKPEGIGCIADALEYDNHRFDRGRFFTACGASEGDA